MGKHIHAVFKYFESQFWEILFQMYHMFQEQLSWKTYRALSFARNTKPAKTKLMKMI